MTTQLNPYLGFDGDARAALEFYQDVFGGNLSLSTFGDFGAAGEPHADLIMHGTLETDRGFALMASDTPPGMSRHAGDAITVSLSGDDGDDLHRFWERLSDGGTVSMPLAKQMWGDEFGMCTDRFGVPWMVNISSPTS